MKKTDRKPAAEAMAEETEVLDAQPETEAPAGENAEETQVVDTAALQAALEKATAQADEYLNLAQRVQADFDNYRRRNATVSADSYAEGQRKVAADLLPVLDNLERALAAAAEESPLRSGVELTLKQMNAAYEKLGVKPIDRLGEVFDPNLEEAVMQGTADEGEPGTVCTVFQKGYMMGDKVLRHAMVKVVAE